MPKYTPKKQPPPTIKNKMLIEINNHVQSDLGFHITKYSNIIYMKRTGNKQNKYIAFESANYSIPVTNSENNKHQI